MMVQHCLQSWKDAKMTIGHGPTPTAEGQTEASRTEPSEQKKTTPQAPYQQTLKTNTAAHRLLMDSALTKEVTTMERDAEEDDGTDRPERNMWDNDNGPTAPSLGQIEPTHIQQSDANVDPLPTPMPLRHLKGRKKELP